MDIKSMVTFLTKTLSSSLKKYWWLNLFIFIFCGSIAFYKYSNTQITYKATASFDYNFFYKKMYGDHLLDLKNAIIEKDYEAIAKKMNVDPKVGKSLLDLKAYNIFGTALHEDFTKPKLTFYVDILASNSKNAEILTKGLLYYMNTIPKSQLRIEALHNQKRNELSILNKELVILNQLIDENNIPHENSEDLQNFFKLYEDKNHRKSEVHKTLNIDKCIQLVKGLNFSQVSKLNQLKSFIIKMGLLFGFCMFILSPFLYIVKDYKGNE